LTLLAIREILSAGTLLKVAEICSATKDTFRFIVRKNPILLQLDHSKYEFLRRKYGKIDLPRM